MAWRLRRAPTKLPRDSRRQRSLPLHALRSAAGDAIPLPGRPSGSSRSPRTATKCCPGSAPRRGAAPNARAAASRPALSRASATNGSPAWKPSESAGGAVEARHTAAPRSPTTGARTATSCGRSSARSSRMRSTSAFGRRGSTVSAAKHYRARASPAMSPWRLRSTRGLALRRGSTLLQPSPSRRASAQRRAAAAARHPRGRGSHAPGRSRRARPRSLRDRLLRGSSPDGDPSPRMARRPFK